MGWALPAALCGTSGRGWLHAWVALALGLAVAGTVLAVRMARGAMGAGEGDRRDDPLRFLGAVAALFGGLLVLSLAFAWFFIFGIGPCR